MKALTLKLPGNEHTAAIDQAAAFLRGLQIGQVPQPVIPALRQRFGLTAMEACQAIAEARR